MRLHRVFALWSSIVFAPWCYGRVSAHVPLGYPNYRLIDRLEAYGCARATLRALKPQGQSDLRDALLLTESGVDACVAPEWLLKEREVLLRPALQNDVRLGTYVFHDDTIPLPGLEASVDSVFPGRQGRTAFNGPNLFGEAVLNADGGREFGLAASLTPGWVGGLDDYRHLNGRFYLHEGYLKVGWRRVELTYGRMAPGFGDAQHGSLLLGTSAKPLNLWRVALRPSATAEVLGPFSLETWIADQEITSFVKNARLWGIAIAARPFSPLEVAFLQLYQFGGTGAPSLETSDYLNMLWFSGDPDLAPKRHRTGALHLGAWGPSSFVKGYVEFLFDDIRSVDALFSEDVSVLLGIWFPKLGKAEARLEYVHIVPQAYGHSFWKQGLTYQRTPLGHPLGEDADGLYLDVGLPPIESLRPGLSLFYESRGRTPGTVAATEWRYGLGLELQQRWANFDWEAAVRVARALNHGFQTGENTNIAALYSTLRYSFF